jgi:hypothetical protein
MATKTATRTPVKVLDRTEIAATGVVLYEVASESKAGYIYYITCHNGKVDPQTHLDCEGFQYRGHCRHVEYVEQAELNGSYDVVSQAEDIAQEHQGGQKSEQARIARLPETRHDEAVPAPAGIEKFFKPAPEGGPGIPGLDKMVAVYREQQAAWEQEQAAMMEDYAQLNAELDEAYRVRGQQIAQQKWLINSNFDLGYY